MKSNSAGYPFISHIPAKGRHEMAHILLQEFNLRKIPQFTPLCITGGTWSLEW
jgi:hypothetical protein